MPESEIDYQALSQDALRGVIREVLRRVAAEGLPGEHHFYIAFDTQAEGVVLSKRLREQYPEEMTVVLQHRFWDLKVRDESFEVKLTFGNIPERLSIPFRAIKVFFDPSVPFGLQFEASEMMAKAAAETTTLSEAAGAQQPGQNGQDLDTIAELPLPEDRAAVDDLAREPVSLLGEAASEEESMGRWSEPPQLERATDLAQGGSADGADTQDTQRSNGYEQGSDNSEGRGSAKVVELDAFRKKQG